MSNVSVKFVVNTNSSNKVYIVGSIPQLGSWNPAKAIELKNEGNGVFSLSKMMATGQMVEFKILADKTWDKVEKGVYSEEVQNHIITPEKGLVVEINISRFN